MSGPPLLNDSDEQATRRALAGAPHVAMLDGVRALAAAGGRRVPGFDPLDGGADARMLLLLETPGAGASGDGWVSQDNATPTGANLRRFLGEAGIARRDIVIWNVVPWIVHEGGRNRPLRRGEIRDGLTLLAPLLARLPELVVAVLAGAPARAAAAVIAAEKPGVAVLTMPHPSPTIVCTSPEVPAAIRSTLAQAARLLTIGP